MSSFLVTGGAGFIGSKLVKALHAEGHHVRVLDDFSTGKRENLSPLTEVVTGSICDADLIKKVMEGVDACFHLAAIANVQRCNEDWFSCNAVNVGGTTAVFEAARTNNTPVVWASSAAVYGSTEPGTSGLNETHQTDPSTPYGADKLASELHGKTAANLFSVPNIGLRFFNVYGEGQDPRSPYSGVLSIFNDRMRDGKQLTVYGDGNQTRDFVHVDDVVRAIIASFQYLVKSDRAEAVFKVLNVCTGHAITLNQVIKLLNDLYGRQTRVFYGEERAGDVRRSFGDPKAMMDTLGIKAEVPLADGLADLLVGEDAVQAVYM